MKLIPFKTCNDSIVFVNPLSVRCVKLLASYDDGKRCVAVTVGDYESVYSPALALDEARKLCDDLVARVNEELSGHAR